MYIRIPRRASVVLAREGYSTVCSRSVSWSLVFVASRPLLISISFSVSEGGDQDDGDETNSNRETGSKELKWSFCSDSVVGPSNRAVAAIGA